MESLTVRILWAGLLPWGLAAATTLLAFMVFVPGAWLVDRLMRGHASATP